MNLNIKDPTFSSRKADGSFNVLFSAVMDQVFIEVMIFDARGTILFINRSFEKFLGLSRENIVGQPIDIFKSLFLSGEYFHALNRVMETGKTWEGKQESCTPERDPRRYYITISPIREETGGVVFLSARRDITEMENRERQMQHAGKMEAIGTLAGGIAHDFNNILAGIVGYAELVKEDLEELDGVSPETHSRLDNMISGAMRAKKLIHQILTFSRSGLEVRSPVNAGVMVKEVVQLLRASLPATIRIDLALESDAVILAEPTQIHQVMMNLCTNARDAMQESGGVLSITLHALEPKTEPGQKWVRLRVADTGPGIDRKIRHKVMDPFFTTKSAEKGTGMGLSVVHGIVAGLGGSIHIKENVPQGAVFDIDLPLYDGMERAVPEELRRPVRGSESILFVDDESDLMSIAEDGLSRMGYRVIGFDDSGKALEWFRENPGVPDLMVSDVTMPEIPGDLLMQEMHKLRPDFPVLLITGASERVDEIRVREMGAQALLYKPMVLGEMAAVIRQVLDEGKNG